MEPLDQRYIQVEFNVIYVLAGYKYTMLKKMQAHGETFADLATARYTLFNMVHNICLSLGAKAHYRKPDRADKQGNRSIIS